MQLYRALSRSRVLNMLSALFAFAAAVLWFLSGVHPLPAMQGYWDKVPVSDPFFHALQEIASLNCYAALCAAASAMLFAGATVIDATAARRQPPA